MISFNKLPKIEEIVPARNETIKEYCNSKFYLSSIDLENNNLINEQNLEEQLELRKSRLKLIEFLGFGGRIFCDKCNFKLKDQIYYFNDGNLSEFNKLKKLDNNLKTENNLFYFKNDSLIDYSICSLHNPPIYQDYDTIDSTIQKKQISNLQKSDRQL